jgi:arylsulfatase
LALYFQFAKNRAIRTKEWKLVQIKGNTNWELYKIDEDRTELNDVASKYPEVVKKLNKQWMDWFTTAGNKWSSKGNNKGKKKNKKSKRK